MERRHAALVTIVGLAVTLAYATANASPHPNTGSRLVGQMAPSLGAVRVAGTNPVSLSDLRGHVVLVDFWATWCRPCVYSMPSLDRLHQANQARGLNVIGVTNESVGAVQRFLGRRPVSYAIARDTSDAARRYGVRYLPTLIVIDRAGKVRRVFEGVPPGAELEQLVAALLAEATPAP